VAHSLLFSFRPARSHLLTLVAPTPPTVRRRLGASVLLIVALGVDCGKDRPGAGSRDDRTIGAGESFAHAVTLPTVPYHAASVLKWGLVTGRVLIDGPLPAPLAQAVAAGAPKGPPAATTVDQRVCGTTFPDESVLRSANALGGVVIWISDITAGKPLPNERRLDVTQEQCQFEPRVQAAVAGSTVDVHSADPTISHTQVVRAGTNDTITTFATNDAGEVVPSARIAKMPGLAELRGQEHPWMRAYIAVFDNPYFAVTGPNGAFRMDSVPTGRYHLMAWHERGEKPVSQEIDVSPGVETKVEVKVRLR
jgi:hypothetical protein